MASGSDDRTIRLWDVATGTEKQTLTGHTAQVTALAFSPDGKFLVSGSEDLRVKIWDIAGGKEVRTITSVGHVPAVVFSKDGKRILAWAPDGSGGEGKEGTSVNIYEVATGNQVGSISDSGRQTSARGS